MLISNPHLITLIINHIFLATLLNQPSFPSSLFIKKGTSNSESLHWPP